ncbi:hypothetical protein ACVWYF_003892 [Hymenobacter sp. UYAg731]
MSSPFGPGYPPLRFASALRAASRWSAWLLSLLRAAARRYSPHHAENHPSTTQTHRQPTASRAARPSGRAARPAPPNPPPRCRPSLSFPALPPRRCATSIRRFVPALLIPYACYALVASVIAAPSRPSPHRTDSIAATESREASQRQPAAPPPGRARPPKASRHPSAPPDSVAGRRPKKPATRGQSLRSGHAGRSKARFAEGFIGEGPKPPSSCPGWKSPVIFLGFRCPKRPLHPHKAGSAEGPLGARRPQTPAKRHLGVVWSAASGSTGTANCTLPHLSGRKKHPTFSIFWLHIV